MGVPANFDSDNLDSILVDWICALREFSVEAVVVLGPDPFGGPEDRSTLAVHPPVMADAANALAESRDFGAAWRESDAPLVAWQHIAKSDRLSAARWRMLSLAHGYQTVIRVEFTLPAGRAFECFMFSPRSLNDRAGAASLVWSALNVWPLVKRAIAMARSTLSPRERECLKWAAEGKSGWDIGHLLDITERTVIFHMHNACEKLGVATRQQAVAKAMVLGLLD